MAGLLKLAQDCLAFLQPQLLRWLLAYIARYQEARFDPSKHEYPGLFEGFIIAFVMFTSATFQSVTLNQACFLVGFLSNSADVSGPNYSIFSVHLKLGIFLLSIFVWTVVLSFD